MNVILFIVWKDIVTADSAIEAKEEFMKAIRRERDSDLPFMAISVSSIKVRQLSKYRYSCKLVQKKERYT